MKTFIRRLEDSQNIAPSLSPLFMEEKFCIVDIETTGLSHKYHQVVLIGLLYIEDNEVIIKQFLAENTKEEKQVLLAFLEATREIPFTITYNGASFDIPFLKMRFKRYEIPWSFNDLKHLDLLQWIKRYRHCLELEDLKLKTVEKFLGVTRRDTISGKESVELYLQYQKNPSPSLEKTILLHNFEDIFYLLKVTHIVEFFPSSFLLLPKTCYSIELSSGKIDLLYHPEDIKIKKGSLCLKGRTSGGVNYPEEIHYTSYYNFQWTPPLGSFSLELPLGHFKLPTKEKVYCLDLKEMPFDFESPGNINGIIYEGMMEVSVTKEENHSLLVDFINQLIITIFKRGNS